MAEIFLGAAHAGSPSQPVDENEFDHPAKLGIGADIGIDIELAVWQGSHWASAAASIPIPTPNSHFVFVDGVQLFSEKPLMPARQAQQDDENGYRIHAKSACMRHPIFQLYTAIF
jgi:hypothetical protein